MRDLGLRSSNGGEREGCARASGARSLALRSFSSGGAAAANQKKKLKTCANSLFLNFLHLSDPQPFKNAALNQAMYCPPLMWIVLPVMKEPSQHASKT